RWRQGLGPKEAGPVWFQHPHRLERSSLQSCGVDLIGTRCRVKDEFQPVALPQPDSVPFSQAMAIDPDIINECSRRALEIAKDVAAGIAQYLRMKARNVWIVDYQVVSSRPPDRHCALVQFKNPGLAFGVRVCKMGASRHRVLQSDLFLQCLECFPGSNGPRLPDPVR